MGYLITKGKGDAAVFCIVVSSFCPDQSYAGFLQLSSIRRALSAAVPLSDKAINPPRGHCIHYFFSPRKIYLTAVLFLLMRFEAFLSSMLDT